MSDLISFATKVWESAVSALRIVQKEETGWNVWKAPDLEVFNELKAWFRTPVRIGYVSKLWFIGDTAYVAKMVKSSKYATIAPFFPSSFETTDADGQFRF